MLLFRLILLIAVGFLVYRIYRMVIAPRMPGAQEKPKLEGEDMVRCALCDVHVPRAQALEHTGHWYCCDDHRRQHQDRTKQD